MDPCQTCKHLDASLFAEPCVSCDPLHLTNYEDVRECPEPAQDTIVVKPLHYTKWAIEPATFIMRNGFEFWRGNIIKYAARAGSKIYDGMDETQSEITDLKKVIRYAEMRINQLNGEVEL